MPPAAPDPAPPQAPSLRAALCAAWPALAAVLVVAVPWLASPPFLDDWHLLYRARQAPWTWDGLTRAFTFLDPSSIESWNLPALPAYHYFRPLVVASLKVDLALFGPAPVGLHLVGLLGHLASVVLVAAIALRLGAGARVARLAALLFGLQPQAAVAVVWTAGRTEVLATAFMLGALYLYLVARDERRLAWILPAVALQTLACLSKESAVLLPACLAIVEIARQPRDLRRAWAPAAPLVALTALYLAYRLLVFQPGAALGPPYFRAPTSPGFASYAALKTTYVLFSWLTTIPLVPVLGTQFLAAHPVAAAGCLAVVLLLGWLASRRWPSPLAVGGVLWLGVSLLPTAPLPAIDLYLYLGSVGLALLLADALGDARSLRQRRLAAALVGLYAVGFVARGLLYRAEGVIARRVTADILADVGGRPPRGATLYFINMPFTAAHTASMVRLLTGDPGIRGVLVSLSPEWATPGRPVRVDCLGPRALRVHPADGQPAFFTTPEERTLHLLERPFDPRRAYRAPGVTVTPVLERGAVVALDLLFDRPLSEGADLVYSFHDDGRRIAHRCCAKGLASEPGRE